MNLCFCGKEADTECYIYKDKTPSKFYCFDCAWDWLFKTSKFICSKCNKQRPECKHLGISGDRGFR